MAQNWAGGGGVVPKYRGWGVLTNVKCEHRVAASQKCGFWSGRCKYFSFFRGVDFRGPAGGGGLDGSELGLG